MNATPNAVADAGYPLLASVDTVITLGGVHHGDLIVVQAGRSVFTPFTATFSCAHTGGATITWKGPFYTYGPGNGCSLVMFYGYAAISPTSAVVSIDITVTHGTSDFTYATASRWSDPFPFAEPAYPSGTYVPADPTYIVGAGSGSYCLADSVAITGLYCSGGWGINTIVSDTGDVEQYHTGEPFPHAFAVSAQDLFLFSRAATGPGTSKVNLKRIDQGDSSGGNMPAITLVFSRPLTLPGGTKIFGNLKPGSGELNTEPAGNGVSGPAGVQTNRPLIASLPSLPAIGDLVWVPVSQFYNGNLMEVTDEYGNTYDFSATSPGASGLKSQFYYTIVEFLPPTGEVFRAILDVPLPASAATYQASCMGIGCLKVPAGGRIDSINFALWDNNTVLPTSIIQATELLIGIPEGTHLIAFGSYDPNYPTPSVAWTPKDDYAMIGESDFASFPATFPVGGLINDPRQSPGIIFSKIAPSDGDYDATLEQDNTNAFSTIILMAVVIALAAELEIDAGFGMSVEGDDTDVPTSSNQPAIFEDCDFETG